jgi:pseudouridine synthase
MSLERLQKVLARAGIASRRGCEELIRQGRVAVNGVIVTEMGIKVDPERDQIQVDGEPVRPSEPYRYLLVHKPAGYLSVMNDPRGRRDLGDLIESKGQLFPVGRLDMASEGLILLTNDGELANRLMHPRYEHPKTYLALVRGRPQKRDLWKLRRGVKLEDGRTAPAHVSLVDGWPRELIGDWWQNKPGESGLTTWLRITLYEGKKRQIRRMLSAVGYPVLRLIRVKLGPLCLGKLPPGHSRPLSAYELHLLWQVKRADQGIGSVRHLTSGNRPARSTAQQSPSVRRRGRRR